MVNIGRLGTSCAIAFLLCAGTAEAEASDFDPTPFLEAEGPLLLCFDLRSDRDPPPAGLLLRGVAKRTPSIGTVYLPFGVARVGSDRSILSTSGSYGRFSLVSYLRHSTATDLATLAISPITNEPPDNPFLIDDLQSGVYFVRSGLERRFILVMKPEQSAIQVLSALSATGDLRYLERVAVALPEDARGREIRNGLTTEPAPSYSSAGLKVLGKADGTALERVQVRYEVQPNWFQEFVLRFGIKLILAALAPTLALLLMPTSDVAKPKAWRVGAAIFIPIQLLILAAVVWTGLSVGGHERTELFSNLFVAVFGGSFAAWVLWIKKK